MIPLDLLIALLLLGVVVGFMAGLLGIGGGGIMVPVLTTLFIAKDFPKDQVVHIALGTSMASIIITAVSSLRAHHRRGGVLWKVVLQMTPGVVLGALSGAFFAAVMSTFYLAIFFTLFMAYVSVQMFMNKQPKPVRTLPNFGVLAATGTGIGVISSLVAIGGGSLTVPFLVWNNIELRTAIGSSAALGLPIAVAGAAGFLWVGWYQTTEQDNVIGFIYWPAVLAISSISIFTAPLGAHTAHALPVPLLKKIFALVLIGLSIKMLASVV